MKEQTQIEIAAERIIREIFGKDYIEINDKKQEDGKRRN